MSALPTRVERPAARRTWAGDEPRLVWCRGAAAGPHALPAPGEVHLWRFRIANESGHGCLPLLAPDERERAVRLLDLRARHQAIVSRASLRRLLGGYLGTDPARIEIATGMHGKPRLRDGGGSGLEFNLSHSRDLLLIGVATGCALGVDVEHLRPVDDLTGLMRVALTPEERADVESRGAEPSRLLRFFQLWTRKEASLKASGEGIVAGLARSAPHRFRTHDLILGAGLVGAVATDRPF
ncbi:4'-phosphopantetheinyl transferase [Burkholderiaceae bacterium]|nr:4'-phosphopantetheinyl transferase [Burkholderiaceae bacterium]